MIHVGGYHEYHGGCSVPWGTQITKDFPPTVLNTLHGTHDIPHGTEHPTVLKISPYGTEHPYCTQDIPPRYL